MDDNYWGRVTETYQAQREKGLSKYGHPLELNPDDITKRLNHLKEELIDALMYIEWIKEKINVK